MARVPAREAGGRIEEALALVGLEAFGDRLPGQLSGGQQQRVAVARALVNRPAVLLLDEPLGALDLKLRKRLQIELSQIHRDVGTTFVYVTHDQEEAMSMSTRIAVMSDGQGRADRHAERDLLPAELALRRRLHRRVQLPATWTTSRSSNGVVHLADGRRRPLRRRTAGPAGHGDADGAARVDPRRSPGEARTASLERTHRADVVSREPDAHRGRVRRGLRCRSPFRNSVASASPHATSPRTGRCHSGGIPTTQCCCRKRQPKRRGTNVSLTEGRLNRADLLKAGAAGALGLTSPGPAFARRCAVEATTLNMAHLVGSLRERPAARRSARRRGSRAGRRCSATTPTRT